MPKARAKRSVESELLHEAHVRAAAEKHYHDLFDAVPDVILEVDSKGSIVSFNAPVEELFGYSPSELMNQPVELRIPEDVRPTHGQHQNKYVANPTNRAIGSNLELHALHPGNREIDRVAVETAGYNELEATDGGEAVEPAAARDCSADHPRHSDAGTQWLRRDRRASPGCPA